MPQEREALGYRARFSAQEMQRIEHGLVPQQMEDKWFIYYEDGWLHFHRSWSGLCIYSVHLRPSGDAWEVDEAWVNRLPAEYGGTNTNYDERLVAFLIERLLLGRDTAFPLPSSAAQSQASVFTHHMVGYARSNDDER